MSTTVLRLRFHGPLLANTIEGILNRDIRGRVHVASVEWPISALPTAITGGWLPVTVHGVEVYDDGGGGGMRAVDDADRELLLKVERATGYIDAHAFMFGNHDLVIKDLEIPDGGYVLIKEVLGPASASAPEAAAISLLSVFLRMRRPALGAGLTATTAPRFDIRNFSFANVCAEIQFLGFRMVAQGASGAGFLYSDMSDPLSEKMYYSLSPTAERGIVRVGIPEIMTAGVGKRTPEQVAEGCLPLVRDHASIPPEDAQFIYDIPVHDIRVKRLAQLPTGWPRDAIAHDVQWDATARSDEGAEVAIQGGLLDYWVGDYGGRYAIDMRVRNAGPLAQRLSQGVVRGEDLQVDARVEGPALGPRIAVHASGMDISLPLGEDTPRLDLHLDRTTMAFDLVTEAGFVEDTVARGAGGEVALAAGFSLDPFQFDLQLDIDEPIMLGPYLPREVQKLAGNRLRGYLRIEGDGARQRLEPIDLWLGRARVSGALIKDEHDRIHTRSIRGNLGKTEVNTRGVVDLVEGSFDLRLALASRDADRWLRYLDAPPMATGLDGTVQLTGNVRDPHACASLDVSGIPIVDQVKTWLGYRGEVLSVDVNKAPARDNPCARRGGTEARPVLGGSLWASGRMRTAPRMRVLSMKAQADSLDLGKVPDLDGMVGGTMSATATASGPIARLDARADVALDQLTIAGDAYQVTTPGQPRAGDQADASCENKICFRMQRDGTKQLSFALAREGGGELGVRAALDARDALSGEITLKEVPIDRLEVLEADGESLIGGVVTAALTLGGTLDAPTLAGRLGWGNGWYGSAFIGHSDFRVHQGDELGTVDIEGTLLQGDLEVTATVHTQAPHQAKIHLTMRRFELDRFAPELAREMKARAWVSGTIDIETTLMPEAGAASQGPAQVIVRLREAELMMANEDSRGRPAPIRLHNAPETPILVDFDGTRAKLLQTVTLVGPAGATFTMSGQGSADELSVALQGDIDLALLEPYVREHFDEVSGRIQVDAAVRGSVAHPRVEIDLDIEDTVAVRPSRQEATVSLIKGGRITITNDQIVTTGTRLVVEDRLAGQQATLVILGNVGLDDFVPTQWALQMEGELAGKMLLVAAPEVFSHASGMAKLWVSVAGASDDPIIDVELDLATEQPLSLTPRGLGREIRFTSGQIELSEAYVLLRRVAGWIGDEGRITDVSGKVALDNWQPARADVTLSADNLPFRIPQTLDLNVNINGLEVAGSMDEGLRIGGAVEVVDGRYIRRFNLITDVLSPERSTSTSKPFYESVPLLANARLDLILDVRGFAVQNNLATIQMSGDIEVAGSPKEPRFNGKIQVDQGDFKLPGARAKFTRTHGAVTFSESKEFPTQTPELNVQSEGDYRDSSGQYHLITLTIEGPLSRPKWDLYTSSGLNKGQTVTMLFSGRTPAELRKSLGDEAPGTNTGRIDPSTSTSENVADQLLKDLAGDFISLLVEDTLRNLTNLDVARIEIGTGSIGFSGEKVLADNARVSGNFEQTGSGRTVDVRGEVQISDEFAAEAGYLNKDYDEAVPEEDISDFRLRAVWRRYFFWP